MRRRFISATLAVLVFGGLVGCTARLEATEPERVPEVDKVRSWSEDRTEPYTIPERQLRAYAYAAWKVGEDGCVLGWPTPAALGELLSDHGRVNGSEVLADGTTTVELRGLNLFAPDLQPAVPDTDGGDTDGDAALTMATLFCRAGNPAESQGWTEVVGQVSTDPEFVVAVHDKAKEYSR